MKAYLNFIYPHIKKSILYRALRKFIDNNDHIRSDAIAYSLVLSIIPLVTVLVKYAEVDRTTIRFYITQFMAAYGIPDSTEILLVIDGILNRADTIAGIGTIFVIFGATNALRHLETSFNSIYQAKNRALLYRFSLHISSIIIIPGLSLILGSSIIYLFRSIEPPGFMSMIYSENNIWIANNRGYVIRMEGDKITKIDLSKKVETGAPFRNIFFDVATRRAGRDWEMNITSDKDDLEGSDFLRIKKIATAESSIYVISDNGALFFSEDNGSTWNYNILNIISKKSLIRRPLTEDLYIDSDKNVFILTTTQDGSQLIKKNSNGEFSMSTFAGILRKIHHIETGNLTYSPGLYLSGSGMITYSENGKYWTNFIEVQYGNRKPRINTIVSNQGNKIFFAGNNGALWYNEDGVNFYPDFRSAGRGNRQSIKGLVFFTEDKGLLYGTDDLLRFTLDGGKTWLFPENEILSSFTFFSHQIIGDELLIVGENETLLSLSNPRISRKIDDSGKPMIGFDIKVLNRRSAFLSFLYNILVYIIIFILFFIFFTLLYILLPNAKVLISSAISGAAFTSSALIIFLILIRLWWLGFSGSAYIYGIWAIVPLGMMLILISLQIILYGLELSYLIQKENLKMKNLAKSGAE